MVLKTKKKARKIAASDGQKESVEQSLSLKYKQDAILIWYCNGGVLDGKRVSRKQLAERLGLTEYKIQKLIVAVKDGFTQMFNGREMIKQQVFTIAGTLLHQLSEDRARAVIHTDQLDEQVNRVRELLDKAYELSEAPYTEENIKRQKIASLMNHLRYLNAQRTESIKLMSKTSEGLNNFLGLFSSNGKSQISLDDIEESDAGTKYLDYPSVIRVIEEKSASVLPTQNRQSQNKDNRNPNKGFEELGVLKKNKQVKLH